MQCGNKCVIWELLARHEFAIWHFTLETKLYCSHPARSFQYCITTNKGIMLVLPSCFWGDNQLRLFADSQLAAELCDWSYFLMTKQYSKNTVSMEIV